MGAMITYKHRLMIGNGYGLDESRLKPTAVLRQAGQVQVNEAGTYRSLHV
jgi:hypothetical protein